MEGWRRTIRAPAVVLGLLALTWAMSVPLAMTVGRDIETQLGPSRTSDRLLYGWDPEWAGEFQSQATGPARTLTHEILGFGAWLATLSQILDAEAPDASLWAVITAYAAVWLFLSGGVLDRLARGRPVGTAHFFGVCAVFAFRFGRLAVLILPLYAVLFLWVHPLLFETVYGWWIRDVASEGRAVAFRLALYVGFVGALVPVSMLSDFAKVRMVVEDRRSAVSALAASARFVRRRVFRVLALYGLNVLAALVLARLWLQVVPGAGAPVWVALLASQVYLVARLWARIGFLASEVAFFQGDLAHAQYAAPPDVVWPDSPAVESLRRLGGP